MELSHEDRAESQNTLRINDCSRQPREQLFDPRSLKRGEKKEKGKGQSLYKSEGPAQSKNMSPSPDNVENFKGITTGYEITSGYLHCKQGALPPQVA